MSPTVSPVALLVRASKLSGAGNQRLSETRSEFDGLNRRTTRRVSFFDVFTEVSLTDGESTTTWAYAPDGAMKRMTDDNGHATRYAYDTKGRLLTETDAKTNLTSYLYDPNGNVRQVKQTDRADVTGALSEFTQTFQFDELDRCIVDFDNVGNTNRYGYDSRGNLLSSTDPRGNETTYVVNGLGLRAVSDCCSAGAGYNNLRTTRSDYDDNGRLTAFTDGNSNVTRYAYDALDRRFATTNADGTTHKLIWSPRSNLVRTEDANGTVVSNSFDLLDRCVRRDITPGGGVAAATTFEWFVFDGASRLMLASNDVSMMDFRYDSLGHRIGGKADCLAMFATFDGEGNRLSLTYPSGGVVNYTYDALDQVNGVSRTAGGQTKSLATFAYEGPGRPGRVARGNTVNTRLTWNGLKNPPNAAGDSGFAQVSSVNHQIAGGGATIDRRIAAYDRNQNKILRQQTVPFASGVPALTTNVFGYDALNQMTSFSRRRASTISTKTLALDKEGNRQSVSSNGVVEIYTMDATTPEPADFQMNQYTLTPFGTESHDHNGNLVSISSAAGVTLFTYDYADQLVLVQRTGAGGLEPVAAFSYDALGRRISKTTFPPAPALPVRTYFVPDPDGDEIIEEQVNGVAQAFAVWPHMHQSAGHARISPGGEILWVHVDELGSALAVTDDAGTVRERYDYAEFGEPRFFNADGVPLVDAFGQPVAQSPLGVHHLFGGNFWDGETGLYMTGGKLTKADAGRALDSAIEYVNPKTGKPLTHVHGDPHVDQKDGTRFDFVSGGNNPWTPGIQEGKKGLNAVNVKLARMSSANQVPKVTVRGWNPTTKTSLARLPGDQDDAAGAQYNPKELNVDRAVRRDAASGQATGRRSYAPGHFSIEVNGARDVSSGQSTGRRAYSPGHFGLELDGARDTASGQATGRRSYAPGQFSLEVNGARDVSSGQSTGRRAYSAGHFALDLDYARDAASGQATGRRLYGPGAAHWGCAKWVR